MKNRHAHEYIYIIKELDREKNRRNVFDFYRPKTSIRHNGQKSNLEKPGEKSL